MSSSSTVSSLKDWPAADCAPRQLLFRLISLFAAFTRRTLKAWVRKCLSPTDTLPLSPGGRRPSLRPARRRSRGSGQQAGQGQGHCVLHTDFLWQRLNDPVIFRGSFRRDQAQCQGMRGASCSASRRVSSGTFPATVLPGENRSLRGTPVFQPTILAPARLPSNACNHRPDARPRRWPNGRRAGPLRRGRDATSAPGPASR